MISPIEFSVVRPLLGDFDPLQNRFSKECQIIYPTEPSRGIVSVNKTSRNIVIHDLGTIKLGDGRGKAAPVNSINVDFDGTMIEACLLPITVMFRNKPQYKDDYNRFLKLSPAVFNPEGWEAAEEQAKITGKSVAKCYEFLFGPDSD